MKVIFWQQARDSTPEGMILCSVRWKDGEETLRMYETEEDMREGEERLAKKGGAMKLLGRFKRDNSERLPGDWTREDSPASSS